MVEKAAVGRGRRREKKQESTCCRSNCGHDGTGFHAFKYLSVGSTRRDEAVAQEGARNSVKRVHLGEPSIESERTREPRGAQPSLSLAHPAREVGVFKRLGVGEHERISLLLRCCCQGVGPGKGRQPYIP